MYEDGSHPNSKMTEKSHHEGKVDVLHYHVKPHLLEMRKRSLPGTDFKDLNS